VRLLPVGAELHAHVRVRECLLDLGEEGGDGAFSGARGVVRNEARTNARTPTRSRSNRKRTLFSLRNEALRLEKMGAISARSAASLPAVCGGWAMERGGVSQLKPRRRRKVTEARRCDDAP
jgi:hypothetical protein